MLIVFLVRNRAKEFAEMLGSVERIKEERKKAKANRNKFVGSEGGGGGIGSGGSGSGFAGSGSKYGGFGSDSYFDGKCAPRKKKSRISNI